MSKDNGFSDLLISDVLNNSKIFEQKQAGLFSVKKANQWIDEAKLRPAPKQLFDILWYEGETCISFADSNVGKSILAVQIGAEISEREPVLYFDFELSDKQFEARYSEDYTNHYIFPDNFYRAEIDPTEDFAGFKSFDDYLSTSLEKTIIESGVKVVIIDNITYLKNETDKAKNALPLMKLLKDIKKRNNLSILVLAHTPKRDLTKPITQNDLQGSKMLMNFCDSSFAIGASCRDSGLRYIKQIKTRNTENKYHSENVKLFQLQKPENRLFMAFVGFSTEREHLKVMSQKEKEENINKVAELYEKGKSMREISTDTGLAVSTVHKYIHRTHEQSNENK